MELSPLSPLQFILEALGEEFGEVLQVKGKINRFGMDSFKPSDPEKKTNRTKLVEEINDVKALIELLEEWAAEDPKLLPGLGDREFIEKRIQKFLHFAGVTRKLGLLRGQELESEGVTETSAPEHQEEPELSAQAQAQTPPPTTPDPTAAGPTQ